MTRVEKYRRYRREISNMKFEAFTQKKEASEQVEEIHKNIDGNKLDYEQVMNVHEVFDDKSIKFKRRKMLALTKFEIIYTIVAILIGTIILVALILTGSKLWG